MKLSNQEQVILKAIGHGVAEISRVIKAVGYPKATVKKVLVRLSEKGAVALHRHDWPQSLKPEQRKLMVRHKGNYYNAVSVMKRNPEKKSKGKTALKKTGRALKGFTRGALSAGAQILGAGAEALNPTKNTGPLARWEIYRKLSGKGEDILAVVSATSRAKALKAFQNSHPVKALEASRKHWTLHTRRLGAVRFDNPRSKKNKTVIKAKRVVVLNPKKKRVKRNASRTVSAAKTAKRRARASGQTGRKKATPRVRSVAKARKAPTRRASKNPTRKGMRRGYAKARRLSKKSGDTKTMRLAARYMKQRGIKHAPRPKRTRKNPDAASIRKEFAGTVNGERDLFFPQGTPTGKLAKLGKLVSLTTEEGTIKPVRGTAWLCADTKGKLHIGSTSGAPLFDGPKRSFGHVTKLEYESSKPHLGYKGPIIWFHRAGEENGIKPTLHADGKGGLVFRGGDYRLTRRGIEN